LQLPANQCNRNARAFPPENKFAGKNPAFLKTARLIGKTVLPAAAPTGVSKIRR
jgi:hypothetical protein